MARRSHRPQPARSPLVAALILGLAAATAGAAPEPATTAQPAAAATEPTQPTSGPPRQPERMGPRPCRGWRGTRVVLLGTGTPVADPGRSGPALAVVVDGRPYLVDAGPGVVRRAAAGLRRRCPRIPVGRLERLFITHLHSDHTAGLADVILTPWVLGRKRPLRVFGPPGTQSMVGFVLQAYREDIALRRASDRPLQDQGIRVLVEEVAPGEVYRDERVRVQAIAVRHGLWAHAYGYRFDTADRSVVISGDTAPCEALVRACDGCDVLIHEVYARAGLRRRDPDWRRYLRSHHTSAVELGRLARRARPRLLVLVHQLDLGVRPAKMLAEVRRHFRGRVIYGKDLMVL
jgi:ribonuclease Z